MLSTVCNWQKKNLPPFNTKNLAEISNAGFVWISKTINWLDFMLNLFIKNKKQKEAKGRDRLCQRTLWLDWIRHSQGTLELTASSLIYKMPVQDGDSFSWMGKDSSGLTSILRMYRHVNLSRVGDKRLFSENPRQLVIAGSRRKILLSSVWPYAPFF